MNTVSFKVPIIDNVKTGQNIKELRKAKGMSVRELKDALGLSSSQAIYKWQWGDALPVRKASPYYGNYTASTAFFPPPLEKLQEYSDGFRKGYGQTFG